MTDILQSSDLLSNAAVSVIGEPTNTNFFPHEGKLTIRPEIANKYLGFAPLDGKDALTITDSVSVADLATRAYIAIPRPLEAATDTLSQMLQQTSMYLDNNDPNSARALLVDAMQEAGWSSSLGQIKGKEAFDDGLPWQATTPSWHIPNLGKDVTFAPKKGLLSFETPRILLSNQQQIFDSVGGAKKLPDYFEPVLPEEASEAPIESTDVSDEFPPHKKPKNKKGIHPRAQLEGDGELSETDSQREKPKKEKKKHPKVNGHLAADSDAAPEESIVVKRKVQTHVKPPVKVEIPAPPTTSQLAPSEVEGTQAPSSKLPAPSSELPAPSPELALSEVVGLPASADQTVKGASFTLKQIETQLGTRYMLPDDQADTYLGFLRVNPSNGQTYRTGDIKSALSQADLKEAWVLLAKDKAGKVVEASSFMYTHNQDTDLDKWQQFHSLIRNQLHKADWDFNQNVPAGVYHPEYFVPTTVIGNPELRLRREGDMFYPPEGYTFIATICKRGLYSSGLVLEYLTQEKMQNEAYILVPTADIHLHKAAITQIQGLKVTFGDHVAKKQKEHDLANLKRQFFQTLKPTLAQHGWHLAPWRSDTTDDYGNLLGFYIRQTQKPDTTLKPGVYAHTASSTLNDQQRVEHHVFLPNQATVRFFPSAEAEAIVDALGRDKFSALPGEKVLKQQRTAGTYVIAHNLQSLAAYLKEAFDAQFDSDTGIVTVSGNRIPALKGQQNGQITNWRMRKIEHVLQQVVKRSRTAIPDWLKQHQTLTIKAPNEQLASTEPVPAN